MLQRLREALAALGHAVYLFFYNARMAIVALALFLAAGYALYKHPPVKTVARGELGLRLNRLTGREDEWREGSVLAIPGVHDVRIFSVRDHVYRPTDSARADGPAPFQSVEGLSLGVDLTVRSV